MFGFERPHEPIKGEIARRIRQQLIQAHTEPQEETPVTSSRYEVVWK